MRDDFSKQAITEIAKGVGYRCSNPECGRATVAANAEQDGTVTIGVAAHICAASSGGPRYEPAQTSTARRAKDNGIWLCQNCGRLIDADPKKFTVGMLLGWKRAAQERAFRELVAPGTLVPTGDAARIHSIVMADDARSADANLEALFAKIHAAASADLAAYKRLPIWLDGAVELTLGLYEDSGGASFSISAVPMAVEIAQEVTILAPPGTGKTTTLLQLAGHVLAARSIVPLYVRLGDWSADSSRLFASVRERLAFKDISQDDMLRLAQHGRVLFLLDGWNELDDAARTKFRVELEQIRRDCPDIRMVVTTRQQALDVPISGPRIKIEPLSEEQEMAIARARFGAAGEKIVDDAWRTPGVRGLIATPLYLSALLSSGSRGANPTTKDELLSLFLRQHEQASGHAEALHATLAQCHPQILIALAAHLNAVGLTTMPEADARRIITTAVARLREQGQISESREPLKVLEVLTSHHTLMRSTASRRAISFQHQQFHEWYASHEVVELMRAGAKGDASARVRLRAAVFDKPAWDESIFFAVERLSRETDSAGDVAHAVRLALPIDPMLAAEMIYRVSPEVWELIKADIIAFVGRWHQVGTVDRAVRFMIMTGRPEFAPLIWPLASSVDSQIQLRTLRTAPRFRPSVLGVEFSSKVAALPEAARKALLSLIASESGVDGMDLAAELAKAESSPQVQMQVIEYLQFRRADRHVAIVLTKAHDETWALLARQRYAAEIRAPGAVERLRTEREKAIAQAATPLERLWLLIEQSSDYPNRDAGIIAAVADASFPVRNQQGGTALHYAHMRAPIAVLEGLRRRLEARLELPFHADDFLSQLVTDEGPIAAAILDVSQDDRNLNTLAVVAGPETVGALIDKYLACAKALKSARADRNLSDEYHRLRSRIAATRAAPFLTGLLARADTDDPFLAASLACLVSSHGDADDRKLPIQAGAEIEAQLIGVLRAWAEVAISSPGAERYQLNDVSNAIGRLGFRELVPDLKRLLDEDLARLERARHDLLEARRRRNIRATSDASMRYGNQYQNALSRLGGNEAAALAVTYLEDRVFGADAAVVLKTISDKQLNLPEPNIHRRWPWLEEVAAARAARAANPQKSPENTLAVPIFAATDRLAKPETDKEGQFLAIRLAQIALAMPHSNHDALIARVMELPQPLGAKRQLLAAIALDGQVLDVDLIVQGVEEWLQEAHEASPTSAWHKRQNTWEIEPWLELLPFTNRPETVFEALQKVKQFYGTGWAKQWERVLAAVAAVPGPEGEALLASLARNHYDIANDFEWMKAILSRESAAAVLLYADLFVEGVVGRGPHPVDPWHVGRELAAYAQKFPELKAELKMRYEAVGAGPGRAMLEHFFGDAGGADDLIAMVNKYAAARQVYDGYMDSAVRAVALRQEPAQDGSISFYIFPAAAARIRLVLFGMLGGNAREAALAKKCLTSIDVLRDEYGIAEGDPRHPDVLSDRPWPAEVSIS